MSAAKASITKHYTEAQAGKSAASSIRFMPDAQNRRIPCSKEAAARRANSSSQMTERGFSPCDG